METQPRDTQQLGLVGSAPSRPRRWLAVILLGINCGVAGRFWLAIRTPLPPLTLDWTPLVYWSIGVVCALMAIRAAQPGKADFEWRMMVVANGLVLAGYLVPPAFLVVRAFSSLTP